MYVIQWFSNQLNFLFILQRKLTTISIWSHYTIILQNSWLETSSQKIGDSDSQLLKQSQQSIGSMYVSIDCNCFKHYIHGTINVMTKKVVADLDSCKVSYRKFVHIIAANAEALDFNTNMLILNNTSFYESWKKIREKRAKNAKKHL